MMRLVALFALALAGCSEPAQSGPPIERVPAASAPDVAASVAAFYAPYKRAFAPGDPADWDRPIFSADLRRLIARWKAGFSDEEVAELQDFSWLCECQDWDSEAFEVGIEPHARPADGRVAVETGVAIGWNETRRQRLELVVEGGEWLIDDIRAESFPDGLKAALARAIEHRAAVPG